MNTIFVEICKQHLLNIITTAKDDSVRADGSVQNAALSYVKCERRSDLAEEKRTLLRKLQAIIEPYTPSVINDQAAFDFFQEQLIACRREILELSRKNDKPEGITGVALSKGIELIPAIFEQLKRTSLLDIPHDRNPLRIFQYYTGVYFSTKVVHQEDASSLQQAIESKQLSNFRTRAREREALILNAMTDCKRYLAALQIDILDYDAIVRQQVKTIIEQLKTNDSNLTTKFGRLLNSSIYVLSFFGGARPDETLLIELLDNALTDINQLTKGLPKAPTSEWIDVLPDLEATAKSNAINQEDTARMSIRQSEETAWLNIINPIEQELKRLDDAATKLKLIKLEDRESLPMNTNSKQDFHEVVYTAPGEATGKLNLYRQEKNARFTIWQSNKIAKDEIMKFCREELKQIA